MTVWPPVDAAEPETEYRWLARVWLLVAAFAAVTLLRSEQVGIGLKDPHGEILRSRLALSLGLFLVLALGDAWLRAGRTDRSARRVLEVLRQRWTGRRLVLAMAVLLADLLGQHVAAYVLMGIYESFAWLVSLSFVAALVFPTRIRDGFVFIASALWVWILGV